MSITKLIKRLVLKDKEYIIQKKYYSRFEQYSFIDLKCKDEKQFEASITRWYHTIEKGLSYINFKTGFGKDNIRILLKEMEEYSKKYDISSFFYQTALSVLFEYVRKNKEYGYENKELEDRINKLPGMDNHCGGAITFIVEEPKEMNYEEFVKSRHSIRHFSDTPLDIDLTMNSIALAQYTPSACNRQGWKCYIVQDRTKIKQLLENQNGNSGFGQEFDKLIVVTGDLRAFNHDREVFQVYIDGGMYAMRVLDSLYYHKIGACPLSASLTPIQEDNARSILNINPAEVFIMYIGIGNYPELCQTTKSERHKPNIDII